MEKARAKKRLSLYRIFTKRVLDIIASALLLIIFLIPGLIIATLIKLTSPGPVLFRQQRVGKYGRPFIIYKFRSMTVNAPAQKSTAEFTNANQYITGIGHFLRKTSVDELPQLLNVLKGDMSVVGPRPLIITEKSINQRRHELGIDQLLPGITGLAQVNGRDHLNDHTKLIYDYRYCQNVSFGLDLKIVVKKISNVLMSKDIEDD